MSRPARARACAVVLLVVITGGTVPAASGVEPTDTYVLSVRDADVVLDALAVMDLRDDAWAESGSAADIVTVELTSRQVARLADSVEVIAAEPLQVFSVAEIRAEAEPATVPGTVTQSGATWGLDRIDQLALPLDGTYSYDSLAGAGVRVYVVDTGVTPQDQLGGRVVDGYSSILDGNGHLDCHGHGTHVAGTVAATTYGVAKAATVVPVRVMDCAGDGDTSTVIAGLNWILAQHPPGAPGVVNMSLTGGWSSALNSAVAQVTASGLTVVVAAANENTDACTVSPASEPSALTVGATTSTDERSSFSNWGACLDLFAPGSSILSLDWRYPARTLTMSGTSMASPHVAGVAALYLAAVPAATPAAVSAAILGAGVPGVTGAGAGSPTLLLSSAVVPGPGVPGAPTLDAATTTALSLAWVAPVDGSTPTGYRVGWRPVGTEVWTEVKSTLAGWTLTGLSPATAYEVRVQAFNGHGTGEPSAVSTFSTVALPTAPTALRSTGSTVTTLDLAWEPPSSGVDLVTGYDVATSLDGATWAITPVPATGTATVDVVPGAHQVRVAARAEAQRGPWSAPISVATQDPPSAPPDVVLADLDTTSLRVSWGTPSPSGEAVTGYLVKAAREGGSWATKAQVGPAITSVVLTGLDSGSTYHVRVAALVGGWTGPWSPTSTARTVYVPTATESYVTSVYDKLFHRVPDAAGLSTWSRALDSGTPRRAVADAITGSAEYRSRLIRGAYAAYLGRQPDAAGLQSWLAAMSRGLTIQRVEAGFVASGEYYTRAGGSDTAWVRALYRDVLGRSASTAEVSHWTTQLARGSSRSSVALGFLLSSEHLAAVIDGHYRDLLGRGIDPSGRASWVTAIQRGTRSEVVIGGIVASAEFWSKNT